MCASIGVIIGLSIVRLGAIVISSIIDEYLCIFGGVDTAIYQYAISGDVLQTLTLDYVTRICRLIALEYYRPLVDNGRGYTKGTIPTT